MCFFFFLNYQYNLNLILMDRFYFWKIYYNNYEKLPSKYYITLVLIKQDIGILYSWRQRILQAFWLSGRGQFLYYTNLQLKEIFKFFFNIQILKLTYLIKDLLFTKWKFMAKNIISDGDSIDLPLSLTFECPKKYTAI